MIQEPVSHSKRLTPEDVSRDNSDLWRYSIPLFKELRKENYSKADPEAYVRYCDAAGITGFTEPFEGIDLKLDIEKFKMLLSGVDLKIFSLMLLGMKQAEISAEVELSQAAVSKRLKKIKEKFKTFYF